MQQRCRRGEMAARRAFTLVELLVVIGIIGILISILLPTVAGVNRQAKSVKCVSNLRQITAGCIIRAQERKGWLPLAGSIVASPEAASVQWGLPRGLGDSEQKKYAYAFSPSWGFGKMSIVPLPGAIAPYLGIQKDLSYNDWDKLDKELNDQRGIWKMFQCPATNSFDKFKANSNPGDNTPEGQGVLFSVSYGTGQAAAAWSTNTDYAPNEGVLGYHYDPKYRGRYLGGNLSRIHDITRVVLFTDAKLRAQASFSWFPDPWIVWSPRTVFVGPVTLADALLNNGKAIDQSSFDQKRHDKRMNIAFVDGHVATYRITSGDLERVYLLPPP